MIVSKIEIDSRDQFGLYLNKLGLHGTGVEVGTHRGEFAAKILQHWTEGNLYCVDPWEDLPEYKEQAKYLWDSTSRNQDLQNFISLVEPFYPRCHWFQTTSKEAADRLFEDGELDFVYLDGNHEEPYVTEDIHLWWPKIKSGGLLAGHDIVCVNEVNHGWSQYIQPAVFKFAESQGLDVYFISEIISYMPWSYVIHKP